MNGKLLMSVILLDERVLLMAHFTTRDIAAIAASAALWGILNVLISPIFWQVTRMPFMCDLLAFISLILVIWWTRKFGSASLTGLVVVALTFTLRPDAFFMLGFVVASIFFDVLTRAVGYKNSFESGVRGFLILILFSTLCAGIAGSIIGSFFMGFNTVVAILTFAGLHAVGGIIGGIIGAILVGALMKRGVLPSSR